MREETKQDHIKQEYMKNYVSHKKKMKIYFKTLKKGSWHSQELMYSILNADQFFWNHFEKKK